MDRSVWRSRCERPFCRSARNSTMFIVECLAAVGMHMATMFPSRCQLAALPLQALAAVAADDAGRLAVHEAGGVPLLIKLMDDGAPDMVRSPVFALLTSTVLCCNLLVCNRHVSWSEMQRSCCNAVEHAVCDGAGGAAGACRGAQDGHQRRRRSACPGSPPKGQCNRWRRREVVSGNCISCLGW
jgi:hypothetical protein